MKLGVVIALLVLVGVGAVFFSRRPPGPLPERLNNAIAPDIAGYAAALRESRNPYYGVVQSRELKARLASLAGAPRDRVKLHRLLCADLLRFNEIDEAVQHGEEAVKLARGLDDRELLAEALYDLGVARIRQGMLENCLPMHCGEGCVLPFAPHALYKVEEGPRAARACFVEVLTLRPGDLRSRWLLTIVCMAVGEEAPKEWAYPPLKSAVDIGRFENVAIPSGIDATNLAGGAVMDDFDGDGLLDIVTTECNPAGRMHYWRNDGNGHFTDRAEAAGLGGQLGGLNLVQTDYNNDGRLDLFVMRGAWMRDDGRQRCSLLRNNGDGTFADVTREAGLDYPACPRQSCAWADFDNDGWLDVFVGNESMEMRYPSQLFRNNRDGTFTDVAKDGGVENWRYCKGCAAADYDGDGLVDLYISNFGEPNRLYRNLGGFKFADVAVKAGVTEPINSFPCWWFDYDNDGRPDLFVAGYGRDIRFIAAERLGVDHDGPRLKLYRNKGDGTFEDVTKAVGLNKAHLVMGCSQGDFDNDGWPDLFLGTGFPLYDAYEPNVAYRNDGGRRFDEVTFSMGVGHLPKGHGVAFGDINNDGQQDVFVELGGFYPGDFFYNALFANPGHANRWIALKLEGVKSNRAAIGARIKVTTAEGRSIYSTVCSGSSYGGNSLQAEIGLGKTSGPVIVEITWPGGRTQRLEGVAVDAFYELKEGGAPRRIERKPFKLK